MRVLLNVETVSGCIEVICIVGQEVEEPVKNGHIVQPAAAPKEVYALSDSADSVDLALVSEHVSLNAIGEVIVKVALIVICFGVPGILGHDLAMQLDELSQ